VTTKTSGGKITGLLALTCDASVAVQVGDFVMLNGNYTVTLADGSAPVLGMVSVRNVKRTGDQYTTTFPVANPGGTVTVEVAGFFVTQKMSGGAIAAGAACGIGAGGALLTAGGGVATIGVALTASAAAGQLIDVLVSKSA
jgi:predicted RecA/RadA family phage recombinase